MFKKFSINQSHYKEHIIVALSGGVDSSVAAWLLKQQGYKVSAVFMKNWEDDDNDEYCSSRQDWLDAVSVADILDIDIEAVNFSKEYKENVFSIFLSEYEKGRTPNPDILCNAEIKFKAFLNYALSNGANKIATGHYARVIQTENCLSLLKGIDSQKDQSYFLYRLNQEQLSRTIFPLGAFYKTEVRNIAKQLKLPNATKKDSTGICFIGERPFRAFLNKYLPNKPGPIKNTDEIIIGEHIGLAFYTIGQRKGIGIGGKSGSKDGNPWYVAKKNQINNILYVVQNKDHPWLLQNTIYLEQTHLINENNQLLDSLIYTAKTRYHAQDAVCKIIMHDSNKKLNLQMHFEQAQWAVTSGQSAVLYNGDHCLGGGIITDGSFYD